MNVRSIKVRVHRKATNDSNSSPQDVRGHAGGAVVATAMIPVPAEAALYCPANRTRNWAPAVPRGVRRRCAGGAGDVESAAGAGSSRMAGSDFRPLSIEGAPRVGTLAWRRREVCIRQPALNGKSNVNEITFLLGEPAGHFLRVGDLRRAVLLQLCAGANRSPPLLE